MKFKSLVEKFRKAQETIKNLGSEIVEVYPNSERLVKMTEEIDTASTALDTLAVSLEEALQAAEQDEALYNDLMSQMEASEVYMELKPAERKKLAEYLIQSKTGLASKETLIGYIEKTLQQKSGTELMALYPKAKIIERGRSMDDGSDAFDAYTAGLQAYKNDFAEDKDAAVKQLAQLWLSRGMPEIARQFYKQALKPDEKED